MSSSLLGDEIIWVIGGRAILVDYDRNESNSAVTQDHHWYSRPIIKRKSLIWLSHNSVRVTNFNRWTTLNIEIQGKWKKKTLIVHWMKTGSKGSEREPDKIMEQMRSFSGQTGKMVASLSRGSTQTEPKIIAPKDW